MQGTIDSEQKSKQDQLRAKKKYEGDISELEASLDTAQRVSNELFIVTEIKLFHYTLTQL